MRAHMVAFAPRRSGWLRLCRAAATFIVAAVFWLDAPPVLAIRLDPLQVVSMTEFCLPTALKAVVIGNNTPDIHPTPFFALFAHSPGGAALAHGRAWRDDIVASRAYRTSRI